MIRSKEYTELSKQGQQAEARIVGVLRGGFVLNGIFYAMGAGAVALSDKIENVSDLRFAPYN